MQDIDSDMEIYGYIDKAMDIPDEAIEYMNNLLPEGEKINIKEARNQEKLLE